MSLVIDLRCLQDRNYQERGIGTHARNMLAHAPAFIGLYDPLLPPLPDDVAAKAARLSPHAYIPGASVLLNPSPFSPGQEFLARLLTDERVLKAVCVHDFIPYDDQPHYLTHPINRLEYFSAMAWLRRYDVFLPNSAPTEARLKELYGNVRSVVTGVALPPWIFGITPQKPRHILMIGGDDWRKNPEVLAKAHASSPVLRDIPLVISGAMKPERAVELRAITRVELPGRVSEAEIRALFAQALAVVTPSRAEGFSLPVLEACVACVPSLASDIPAHRALLPEKFLFAPEDHAALAALLEDTLNRRDETVAAQSNLWQEFSEENVTARIFGALTPKPAIPRGAKPRIALHSPMPPVKSGIADHSAALARALAPLAEVDVFPTGTASAITYGNGKYDAILTAIGNHNIHEAAYDLTLRWGGAVLCHDARLLGFAASRGMDHAARLASTELRRAVTQEEIRLWLQDESKREAAFLGELAATARPLIFHAKQPVELVRERFGVEAVHLPFAMQRIFAPMDKLRARAALGIGVNERLVVSFGFLTRGKGIETAIAACERLKCRLIFAGEATAPYAHIPCTGYLPEETYRLYLAAADAGLQLRQGQPGAISGALQDCIGSGLPTVASADLADNIEAPAYVKRVADIPDTDEVAAALDEILTRPPETEQARAHYVNTHSMENYAVRLLETLLP